MSTRKSNATTPTKAENATTSASNVDKTPTVVIANSSTTNTSSQAVTNVDKKEMGANNSTAVLNSSHDHEVNSTNSTPTSKDAPGKVGDAKRITRNSPMLTTPGSGGKKLSSASLDAAESDKEGKESEDVKKTNVSLVKGRKSLKDSKEDAPAKKETSETDSTEKPAAKNIQSEVDTKDKAVAAKKDTSEADTKDKAATKKDTSETDSKDKIAAKKDISEGDAKDKASSKKDIPETDAKDKEKEAIKAIIGSSSAETNKEKEKDSGSSTPKTASKDYSSSSLGIGRQTRKAAAEELASKTRITRNRHSGGRSRSETPPLNSLSRIRRPATVKMPMPIVEAAPKRKRSHEEGNSSSAEPGPKYIKIEIKEESAETSSVGDEDQSSNLSDVEGLKIKQEILEPEEMSTDNLPASTVEPAAKPVAKGRWTGRKSSSNNLLSSDLKATQAAQTSPSTRATRQNKLSSPARLSEPKRRRMAGNSLTRNSSQSLLKTTTTTVSTTASAQDDDSKDSLSSEDVVMALIKQEKLSGELISESEEIQDEKSEDKTKDNVEDKTESSSNGCIKPLSVETDSKQEDFTCANKPQVAVPEATEKASSDKAASLSPELISEGVSEISVQQFYKKPEFLENNLGIEEDPKLGEIVQKVSSGTNSTDKTTKPMTKDTCAEALADDDDKGGLDDSYSTESIKEGDLRLEDSSDEQKKGTPCSDLIEEEEDNKKVEENEQQKTSEDTLDKIQLIEEVSLTNEIEQEEEDDDAEESETISMDNNASLHEEAMEEELTEDVDELELEPADPTTTEVVAIDDIELMHSNDNQMNVDESNIIDESTASETVTKQCDKTEKAKLDLNSVKIIPLECSSATSENDLKSQESTPKLELTQIADSEAITKDELRSKFSAQLKNVENLLSEAGSEVNDADTPTLVEENKENLVSVQTPEDIKLEDIKLIDNMVEVADVNAATTSKTEIKTDQKEENEKKPSQTQQQDSKKTKKVAKDLDYMEILPGESEDVIKAKQQLQELELLSSKRDKRLSKSKETPLSSSHSTPSKLSCSHSHKDDDATSMKSSQSTDTNSWVTLESEHDEETLRMKEQHLQSVGLLTHKAAERRRQEFIQKAAANAEAAQKAALAAHSKRIANKLLAAANQEYTGTLKTVIKLNRNNSSTGAGGTSSSNTGARKNQSKDSAGGVRRQSLKMTFQKGRARAHDRHADQQTHGEEAYYTIQNENEGAPHTKASSTAASSSGGGTAEHLNVHTHDSSHSDGVDTHSSLKKEEKEEILIPEKASSFKFHPGRLCEDQCYYCSGKFGLYDTPCHVGQIKSVERQQKILANEEKLTVDNCLCDACFRHVDRRANVPSYKKRLSAPGHLELNTAPSSSNAAGAVNSTLSETDINLNNSDSAMLGIDSHKCLVPDCSNPAVHSIKTKCIRKSVKKFLHNFDMPSGSTCVWLCQAHYDTVIQCSGCVLCKRRLGKNHMYHITSDTDRLEKSLSEMGIPVQLGIGTAVCKLCRYFANLLMKPPDSSKSQKAEFVKNYRKRLLQFHNIHDGSNDASEADEDSNGDTASTSVQKTSPLKKTIQQKSENVEMSGEMKDSPSPSVSMASSVEASGDTLHHSKTVDDDEMIGDFEAESNSSEDSEQQQQQMSKLKAILQTGKSAKTTSAAAKPDISNVLRSNPNISMRELFHGEEDMGLQFKAPFGSAASQRTPEGWTRVQTFLQYDEPTRRLWEELQKPYGNQSSFLRHLILLEKYYRNGDLILAPHASSNASVYTQTVRQRLVSYDEGHCGGLQTAKSSANMQQAKSKEKDKNKSKQKMEIPTVEINEEDEEDNKDVEVIESNDNAMDSILGKKLRGRSASVDKLTKQLSSNAVTITARPRESSASASPQKSLLKDNKEKESSSATPNLVAANAAAAAAVASASSNNSRSILKSNLLGHNKAVEIVPIAAGNSNINKNMAVGNPAPNPESKQQKILDVANKLLGSQLEAQQKAAAAQQQASLLTSPPELVSLHRRSSGGNLNAASTSSSTSATPSTLTNSLINTKRPQLMPNKSSTAGVGSSGRSGSSGIPNVVILPETLTQQELMQSKSWRPTLMPVGKNQHMLNKSGPLYQTADGRRLPALVQVQSGGKPFLISIFDYNRMCILRREKLLRDQMIKASKNSQELKQQQQQHQAMQKNSGAAGSSQGFNKNSNNSLNSKQAANQPHNAQQQLLQLQLMSMQKHQQQQQQQQAFKSAFPGGRFQPIAPKPSTSSASTSSTQLNPNLPGLNSIANSFPMPLLASTSTSGTTTNSTNVNSMNNASWLWNNFPDANLLLNGGAPPLSAAGPNSAKLPQLLSKPQPNAAAGSSKQLQQQQQQQQLIFDNTFMSKIPKSLTVIPQHKLLGTGAATASSNSTSSHQGNHAAHRE